MMLNGCLFVLQLAQSVIELNNLIQQKDKEIQSNEAKSVSLTPWSGSGFRGGQQVTHAVLLCFQDAGVPAADCQPGGGLSGPEELPAGRQPAGSQHLDWTGPGVLVLNLMVSTVSTERLYQENLLLEAKQTLTQTGR